MNNLNIQEIATAKIKELHESGEIKKRIEEGIQKNIFDAIDSAVKDYSYKRAIEEKVEKELCVIASSMDFSSYTSFLQTKLEEMVNTYVKEDLAMNIKDKFSKVYLNKPEHITLSQILEAYKEWLINELDHDEQQDWERFSIDQEDSHDSFIHFKCGKTGRNKSSSYLSMYDKSFHFDFHFDNKETKTGHLYNATIEGCNLKDAIRIGSISDFEAMIINALFNETPIIIDIDVDDFETYIYNEDY